MDPMNDTKHDGDPFADWNARFSITAVREDVDDLLLPVQRLVLTAAEIDSRIEALRAAEAGPHEIRNIASKWLGE